MPWDPALNTVRDVLADLYQEEEDAHQLVVAAGLDPQRIAFSSKAVNNWTSILTYAHNNDQVDAVLRTARRDFSRNARLAAAEQEWLASKSRQPLGGVQLRPEPVSESRAIGRAATQAESSNPTGNSPRNILINEVRLSDEQVGELERLYHTHMQDAAYWYDRGSGAWGIQGGPTLGFIHAGLYMGGPLRANASNGDTGVFINGRELHRMDVLGLQQLGPVWPGRYWVDAQGNVGFEGGPAFANVWLLAAQRLATGTQGGGPWATYAGGGAAMGDGQGGLYAQFGNLSWSNR